MLWYLNKSLAWLLVYFFILLLGFGVLGNDLVADLAYMTALYLLPLLTLLVLMISLLVIESIECRRGRKFDIKLWLSIGIKMLIACLPVFFLDDSLISVLAFLRGGI